jgi:hypothetical protein
MYSTSIGVLVTAFGDNPSSPEIRSWHQEQSALQRVKMPVVTLSRYQPNTQKSGKQLNHFLNKTSAGRQWLTPVIIATQEAEIRKILRPYPEKNPSHTHTHTHKSKKTNVLWTG